MRVTSNIIYKTLSEGINNINQRLLKTQEALATGKKINKLSDDPVNMKNIMGYRQVISGLEQYDRNINFAIEHLSQVDTMLSSTSDSFMRLKELAVSTASSTISPATRATYASEVRTLYEGIIGFANTQVGERHLFSGYLYDTTAFDSNGNYLGDDNNSSLNISPDENFTYAFNGNEVFKGVGVSGGVDIFQLISDFEAALLADNTVGIQAAVDTMDTAREQIANFMSQEGGRVNRLQSRSAHMAEFANNTKILLSGLEDADITELAIALVTEQTGLEAIQLATAKFANLNLFNFLR